MKTDAQEILPPLAFDLAVARADVDGIELGVLGDGTAYLTTRGLARACGQPPSVIHEIGEHWRQGCDDIHCRRIESLLSAYADPSAPRCRDITLDGYKTRVYPDPVCMAVLEYFAFESRAPTAHLARTALRRLTQGALRRFIHDHAGYGAGPQAAASWAHLHHRLLLNPLPVGYFSVFREIADVLIAAAQSGLALSPHTVPDISAGMGWGRYWTENDLDRLYGQRLKHPHRFPGRAEETEIEAWIYPIAGLETFRAWMRADYLPHRLPAYLRGKAKRGGLAPADIDPLLAAVGT